MDKLEQVSHAEHNPHTHYSLHYACAHMLGIHGVAMYDYIVQIPYIRIVLLFFEIAYWFTCNCMGYFENVW